MSGHSFIAYVRTSAMFKDEDEDNWTLEINLTIPTSRPTRYNRRRKCVEMEFTESNFQVTFLALDKKNIQLIVNNVFMNYFSRYFIKYL